MQAIKFKFCSRKNIGNSKSEKGVKIRGYAYFFINEKGIMIAQIPQIIEAQYRRTDKQMLKTTGYWEKQKVRNFRNNFLSEKNPEALTSDSPRLWLNKNQIKLINEEFAKNENSFRSCLSFLQGSNVSGCETNRLAQPFFYISDDGNDEWNLFNPLNCFKKIYNKDRNFKIDFKNCEIITLKQYFKLFPIVENKGKKYCPEKEFLKWNKLRSIKNINKNLQPNNNFSKKNHKKKIKKHGMSLDEYLEDIKDQLYLYINKEIEYDDKQLKNFIRSRHKIACDLAIQEDQLNQPSFEKDSAIKYHNAHIVSVASLLKNKNKIDDLFNAASPYNCLKLSGTMHDAFDSSEITFTPEGKIISNNENLVRKFSNWISQDIINCEGRKKFIEINYQHWKKSKKNL